MLTALTAIGAASMLAAPQDANSQTQEESSRKQERVRAHMESKLGFTIYEPKSLTVGSLLNYAGELTDTRIEYFYENPTTGYIEVGQRSRFIQMNDVIGVQDFAPGREAAIRILTDLDERLGDARTKAPAAAANNADAPQLRTVRLRALNLKTAERLAMSVSPGISVTPVQETGMLVLQGTVATVGRAESLLLELDKPLPQITLRCALIQAVTGDDPDLPAPAGLLAANDPVAASLGQLLPGKRFRRIGQLLLRGSAGGDAVFSVSSTLAGLGPDEPGMPQARVTLRAVARGLDEKTKTLVLDDCSMQLELPTIQTVSSGGGATQSSFGGYRKEGLLADLAVWIVGSSSCMEQSSSTSVFVFSSSP
ncbi:MAG: hypothetical protein AAGB93_24715, partial [Planctomycetota bacterium]